MTLSGIVVEFFYGFDNNDAGANVSNPDVFPASLRKEATTARMILLAGQEQIRYNQRLSERFRFHTLLAVPFNVADLEAVLRDRSAQ